MRMLGGLDMSLGTSLAFEGQAANLIGAADTVLINLRTIIRNVRFAYEDKEWEDKNLFAQSVFDDLSKIANYITKVQGSKLINLIVYYPTYSGLSWEFRVADLWTPTTKLQKEISEIEEKIAKKVIEKYKSLITQTNCKLPSFSGLGYILTHHVVDLVLTNAQSRLVLLESFTGTLKPQSQWFTKLTGKSEELFNMPLNKLTIQVFGDKQVNFKSSKQALKNLVKELAVKGKWTSSTTVDRVKHTIRKECNQIDKAGLLLLL